MRDDASRKASPLLGPKRPDCWDFAMDFLGDPEAPIVEAYVAGLEAEVQRLRSAVTAKRERRQAARDELVAAWNDLPDALRCHPGLKRLYAAMQNA